MYVVRRCLEDDVCVVDNFFSGVVFKEEPFISINGPHVIPPVGESLSQAVIPQGHSLIAESSDGDVIGVCLNDEPPQIFPSIYTNSDDDIKFQDFFQYMEDVSEVIRKAPNAMEVRLMAVDNRWRKKGVASSLLKASESAALNGGFSYIKIYCTSSYSSNLVRKLGWEKMFSVSYKEYVENLNPDIKIPQEPHTHCDLFVKKIS